MQAIAARRNARTHTPGLIQKMFSQTLGAIDGWGQKARTILSFRRPAPVPVTEEVAKLRSLQSQRIQLRLLSRQGKLADIAVIAASEIEYDIVCVAMLSIANADATREAKIETFCTLARTDSKAAVPAIVCLLNDNETETALELFLDRLENGELESLVQNGYAKVLTILDILGGIDQATDNCYSEVYFERFYDCLADRPHKQVALLSEILGDPDPEDFRGSFEPNLISKSVKLAAIELVKTAPIEMVDRALSFGAKDPIHEVAYNSIVSLNQFWQTPQGRLPIGLEPFPLLDTDTLVRLCQLSSSFSWPDMANASALLESCRDGAAELKELDPTSAQYSRVLEHCRKLEDQVIRLTERRINCLQPLLNKITSALRIPNAQLLASDDPHSYAAYLIGTGTVKVNRTILLDDKPLSEELMSSLLHEIGHLEQDVLMIRMVADELKLRFGQHSDLLLPLYERYSQGIGYAPTSMFLMAVLRLRDDQLLTPSQGQRAHRLFEAMKQLKAAHDQTAILEQRSDRLMESFQTLNDSAFDPQLLNCLKNKKSLDALLIKERCRRFCCSR